MEPENDGLEDDFLFNWVVFRFHVNLPGCSAFCSPGLHARCSNCHFLVPHTLRRPFDASSSSWTLRWMTTWPKIFIARDLSDIFLLRIGEARSQATKAIEIYSQMTYLKAVSYQPSQEKVYNMFALDTFLRVLRTNMLRMTIRWSVWPW